MKPNYFFPVQEKNSIFFQKQLCMCDSAHILNIHTYILLQYICPRERLCTLVYSLYVLPEGEHAALLQGCYWYSRMTLKAFILGRHISHLSLQRERAGVRVSSSCPLCQSGKKKNADLKIECRVMLIKRDRTQMIQFSAKLLLVKYQQPIGRHLEQAAEGEEGVMVQLQPYWWRWSAAGREPWRAGTGVGDFVTETTFVHFLISELVTLHTSFSFRLQSWRCFSTRGRQIGSYDECLMALQLQLYYITVSPWWMRRSRGSNLLLLEY